MLPGHGDGHRATVLRDPKIGLFKYRDAAARRGTRHRWLRLADVRASVAYGYTRTLSGAEAALWYVKLWEEAGVLPMPRVAYAPLFTRLEGDVEIVARAFAEVVGVRWYASPGVPVALTRRFVGAWCDLPEIRARAALDELRRIRARGRCSRRRAGASRAADDPRYEARGQHDRAGGRRRGDPRASSGRRRRRVQSDRLKRLSVPALVARRR